MKMMNKFCLFVAVFVTFFVWNETLAQNFAYVDSEYILENVPEYQDARQELKQVSEEWRDEIQLRQKEIRELKRDFEAERVLLPDDVREERKAEIEEKEKALEQYRQDKFSSDGGELYQKRDQLLEPIKDRVFEAVQDVARDGGLDFIFDRSGAVTMLYYSARYDRSDEVLIEMGIDPPEERDDEEEQDVDDPGEEDRPDFDQEEGPEGLPDDERMPSPDR